MRSPRLSRRVIFLEALRPFIAWGLIVLAMVLAGYPGVVCITPPAWLLALTIGPRVEKSSPTPEATKRLQEAALSGALLGFSQGLLFLLITSRLGPLLPGETSRAAAISMIFAGFGTLAGGALSTFTAWLVQRRERQQV
jgi:hypothetical protein